MLVSDAREKEIKTQTEAQRDRQETHRQTTERWRGSHELCPWFCCCRETGRAASQPSPQREGAGSCQGLFHSNRPLRPGAPPPHPPLFALLGLGFPGHHLRAIFFPGNVSPCPLPQGRMGTQRQHGRGSSQELLPNNVQPEDLGVSQLADCGPKPSFTPADFSGPAAAPRQLPTIRQGCGVRHFEGDRTTL